MTASTAENNALTLRTACAIIEAAIATARSAGDQTPLYVAGTLDAWRFLRERAPANFHDYAAGLPRGDRFELERALREPEQTRRTTGAAGKPAPSLASFVESFVVTEEAVQAMEETRFLWKQIVASGHICVWAAPGNGGKTTIARQAAADMARDGLTVYYLLEDAGAGDLKDHVRHAARHGYHLLNTALSASRLSPADQMDMLRSIGEAGDTLVDRVFILDTLKKYLDAMNKRDAREFFRVLRALTILGATVVLLGHTNKHRGMDGKLVFEGVGDIRNDVDELFYLDSITDQQAGRQTVTLTADKWRCATLPATFVIDLSDRSVTESAVVVDTAEVVRVNREREADADVIDAILAVLRERGTLQQRAVVEAVRERTTVGRDRAEKVLDRWASGPDALWRREPGFAHNAKLYSLREVRP